MSPLREMRNQLREGNKRYTSSLVPVPRHQWPQGAVDAERIERIGVYRSNAYLVQIFCQTDGATRVSVNRTEMNGLGHWKDGITWDALMSIKDQIGYGNRWAVELFPAQDELCNVANIRHLFVLPEAPSYAWRSATAPEKSRESA